MTFDCDFCGKVMSTKQNLEHHIRTHTGEKPFSCEVCSKSFAQSCTLTRHMRVHTGEKTAQCKECGKFFSDNNTLKRHMPLHTGEKPYKCDKCDKAFADASNAREHRRTHNSEKPYFCDICFMLFANPKRLKTHMLVHLAVKPFKCDECTKSFARAESLRRHRESHLQQNIHACNICTKKFKSLKCYTNHMQKHEKGKPFPCPLCRKSFSTEKTLQKHSEKHKRFGSPKSKSKKKNMKCHRCGICEKMFLFKSALNNHMKTHIFKNEDGNVGVSTRLSSVNENSHLNPFSCSLCVCTFATRQALVGHTLTLHNQCFPTLDFSPDMKLELDECRLCGARIQFGMALAEHYVLVHSVTKLGQFGLETAGLNSPLIKPELEEIIKTEVPDDDELPECEVGVTEGPIEDIKDTVAELADKEIEIEKKGQIDPFADDEQIKSEEKTVAEESREVPEMIAKEIAGAGDNLVENCEKIVPMSTNMEVNTFYPHQGQGELVIANQNVTRIDQPSESNVGSFEPEIYNTNYIEAARHTIASQVPYPNYEYDQSNDKQNFGHYHQFVN